MIEQCNRSGMKAVFQKFFCQKYLLKRSSSRELSETFSKSLRPTNFGEEDKF